MGQRLLIWSIFNVALAFFPLLIRMSSQQSNKSAFEIFSRSTDIPFFTVVASLFAVINIAKHLIRPDPKIKRHHHGLVTILVLLLFVLIVSLIYFIKVDKVLNEEDVLLDYLIRENNHSVEISRYSAKLAELADQRVSYISQIIPWAIATLIFWFIVEIKIGNAEDIEAKRQNENLTSMNDRILLLRKRIRELKRPQLFKKK